MTARERAEATEFVIQRIRSLVQASLETSNAPLFLSTLPFPASSGCSLFDHHQSHGVYSAVLRINQAVLDLAASSARVYVFDFAGWVMELGAQAFDLKMDLYARQPLAAPALMQFADRLARTLRPLLFSSAKVLALDLDNVLWGGVVGEDGIHGLQIGPDFPGNVFRRIQYEALALKNRGALLALISKNNPSDVEKAFEVLSSMPITLSDFTAVKVSWREKHESLAAVARELNLGLDSFVFVDDQAFEREQMKFHLPQVRILPVTEDPLSILKALNRCTYFDAYRTSVEDLSRGRDYAMQLRRKELEEKSSSTADFLATLDLRAKVSAVSERNLPRVVQMLGKTNQFNVTTRRHTEAEVRRLMADAGNVLITLSLSDHFGDQGLIALVIAVASEIPDEIRLDSFLMSCRAIGRGAEDVLWSSLLMRASELGYRSLLAEYIASPKNQQVANLFDRFGMHRISSDPDRTSYRIDLPAAAPKPEWITVIEEARDEQS
jgi:FkbH-like protein